MQLIQALASLAEQHPTLPEAYITVHTPFDSWPGKVDLQLQAPQEFELWREALAIAPDNVSLHATRSSTWLAADGEHEGVRIHISGFNVPVSSVQAQAPRDRSAVTA
jgi:hypothetical protein